AWKGVADGFEAVARVTRHVPTLRLVGFGVKPPRDAVPYDEFHLNPPQDRLAAVYSSCEIYLCPSWDEGLGMPPMEAMACGAALVTYDNGGCRDYARDGETALVARRRDVADLAARLELLASDTALRDRIAAIGLQLVQPRREPLALLVQGLGQRRNLVEELTFTIGHGGVHTARWEQKGCRGARSLARRHFPEVRVAHPDTGAGRARQRDTGRPEP